MARMIAVAALLVVLVLVNVSVAHKEQQLAQGRVVYLELAPVDPRSLMQGDYMALQFAIGRQITAALPRDEEQPGWRRKVDAGDGHVVVGLDARNIASFVAISGTPDQQQALAENELRLRYRVRNGEVKFATNAFFFQEGHAQYYEPARYGEFRVDASGEPLLVALRDQELKLLSSGK